MTQGVSANSFPRKGRMKIVFPDRKTLGEDLDLSGFNRFGDVVMYDFTKPEDMPERVRDADILILNKALVNEQTCGCAKHLKLVCVTATGTNNLDKEFLDRRGIAWRNVAGYSTESVVQHTFAMLFYLMEHLPYYDRYVKSVPSLMPPSWHWIWHRWKGTTSL